MLKVKDKESKIMLYAFCLVENSERWFGGKNAVTSEYKHYISKINLDGDRVNSFACTKYASFFLMGGKKTETSMDPEKPEATGLTHFYCEEHPDKIVEGKKAKVWKFISEQEYEERKDSLPDLCFATRHLIKGLADKVKKIHDDAAEDSDWLYEDLPDLEALKD